MLSGYWLPLGWGGHPAGEAGDDAVLEHKLLQARLTVRVVALQDLRSKYRLSASRAFADGWPWSPLESSLCCCSPASRNCRCPPPRSASPVWSLMPQWTLKTKTLQSYHISHLFNRSEI